MHTNIYRHANTCTHAHAHTMHASSMHSQGWTRIPKTCGLWVVGGGIRPPPSHLPYFREHGFLGKEFHQRNLSAVGGGRPTGFVLFTLTRPSRPALCASARTSHSQLDQASGADHASRLPRQGGVSAYVWVRRLVTGVWHNVLHAQMHYAKKDQRNHQWFLLAGQFFYILFHHFGDNSPKYKPLGLPFGRISTPFFAFVGGGYLGRRIKSRDQTFLDFLIHSCSSFPANPPISSQISVVNQFLGNHVLFTAKYTWRMKTWKCFEFANPCCLCGVACVGMRDGCTSGRQVKALGVLIWGAYRGEWEVIWVICWNVFFWLFELFQKNGPIMSLTFFFLLISISAAAAPSVLS